MGSSPNRAEGLPWQDDPLLRAAPPGHLVSIPERALRQPKRRGGVPSPPLIAMLGVGRQAADIRVRLYLWLWAALSTRGFGELTILRTTAEWALLVNALDPASVHHQQKRGLAARRVSRAFDYLAEQRLISRPFPDTVRLLDPDRTGADYIPWSTEVVRGRERQRDDLQRFWGERTDYRRSRVWENAPLRFPSSLWTTGWISNLSGPALVVLMIMWSYEPSPGVTFDIPKSRAYEFPVTHSTWHKGTTDLQAAGVVSRRQGALVFPAANANPRVSTDRFRVRWTLNHPALTR